MGKTVKRGLHVIQGNENQMGEYLFDGPRTRSNVSYASTTYVSLGYIFLTKLFRD